MDAGSLVAKLRAAPRPRDGAGTSCTLFAFLALFFALLAGAPTRVFAQDPSSHEEAVPGPLVVEPVLVPASGRTPEGVSPLASRWSPLYSASSLTRYELRHGYDDLGLARGRFLEGDAFFYRARFGINTGLLDVGDGVAVAAQFTPQAAGTFGQRGPDTIVDAQLGLHEGYARVQGRRVRVDAGRYEMVYGDALMIGNNDWNEVGRTFDGVRARIGAEAWLDLFANVIDEGRPDFRRIGGGDLYFLGAYGAVGPLLRAWLGLEQGTELDLYLLARVWGDAKAAQPGNYRREGAREFTLGARGTGRVGAFDYRAETGLQTGTRPGPAATEPVTVEAIRALAWQGDVEVGLTWWGDRLRVGLEALYATGAKPGERGRNRGWEDLFPSGHKWLGLADAFQQNGQKRTNVGSAVLHLRGTPVERLTVQLDAHLFARPQPTVAGGDDGFSGGELDLGVAYRIANGLKVRALYAVFLPSGNLYGDTIPDRMMQRDPDPAQYFEAELRYDLLPR